MAYLDDNWLLGNNLARRLWHEVARPLPILDYHNHLSPREILEDEPPPSLAHLWLAHDHYKWRAMRWCGVDEARITGSAEPVEKFRAYARVMPELVGSPLYDWTHLELRRVFGIDLLLSAATADEVWQEAQSQMPRHRPRALLERFNVALVGTTDDPAVPLDDHRRLDAAWRSGDLTPRIVPTFRPDKAHSGDDPAAFAAWCDRLASVSGAEVAGLDGLLTALASARQAFVALGARASDHALVALPDCAPDRGLADRAVQRLLAGESVTPAQQDALALEVLRASAYGNAEDGWAMQLHLGPLRNVSPSLLGSVGPDAGADVMGDAPQAAGLARFLGGLDAEGRLPRTVLYNLNPSDNAALATLAGAFQGGGLRGRVQWGAAWWFNDSVPGMRTQLRDLASIGALGPFIGMLTDSRSLLSFSRHEMFRRLLCGFVAELAGAGEAPDDFELLSALVRGIAFDNAAAYFGFELDPASAAPAEAGGTA